MSYNYRNTESKNNDLHTATSKNTEITIEPEKQAIKKSKLLSPAIRYLTAFPKKVYLKLTKRK